jgi:hypothetical protein
MGIDSRSRKLVITLKQNSAVSHKLRPILLFSQQTKKVGQITDFVRLFEQLLACLDRIGAGGFREDAAQIGNLKSAKTILDQFVQPLLRSQRLARSGIV